MTTLVKCRFCLRNGSQYVEIPEGLPVRCQFCKRVQPLEEKKQEAKKSARVVTSNTSLFD